ncbi:MAG: hypothetical protein KGJ78_17750 [Alphaproteobacteria bacterium]|nr:hypothetical protein [Alphaproteobacteria bacterium]
MSEYRPATLVVEAFEGEGAIRRQRIQHLSRSIISLAAMHGTPTRIVSRAEVAAYFASAKPKTRYDVATAVAAHLKEIRHRLPAKRKYWHTADARMALFSASALLFVHYGNPLEPL